MRTWSGQSSLLRTLASAAALALWLAGCSGLAHRSEPLNQPIVGSAETAFAATRTDPTAGDDVLVGLAFSGGGTRAAAFSYGVLQELDRTRCTSRTGSRSLLDRVAFVSGVSGGSVLTAYYGLKKRAALDDFRERFLLRNAEEGLSTSIDADQPGARARRRRQRRQPAVALARARICSTARPSPISARRRARGSGSTPPTSTTARPFVFGEAAFIALCSDLAHLSDRRRGRGLGRGADRVHAGGDQDLSAGNAPTSRRTGSSARATIRTRRRCCGPSPTRSTATTTARPTTSSCSTAGWSTISACRASPSRGCRRARRSSRCRPEQAVQAAALDHHHRRCRPRRRPATGCRPSRGRAAPSWSWRRPTPRSRPASTPATPPSSAPWSTGSGS